ncbi:MAG: UvrD-helicase domain-containing protein [Spirochaetales bacterium]|nr:UvrD-helicase domain-containing protein [Spirochaetales bacterium]MCF7937521.1 UvrD-helicase domain-containing protein [Spirochaetales bacterium]
MKKLNAEQQRAVEVERNAVITAGAGSGKTTVLTERFVRLVSRKENPLPVDRVLALTFTRKAAAEMYERIYSRLRSQLEEGGVREQDGLQKELERFDRARISTIDSFCSEIVRQGGAAYGFPEGFRIDEDELKAVVRREGLDFLLKHGDCGPLVAMIESFGFDTILDNFLLVYATAHAHPIAEIAPQQLWERQQEVLTERFVELLEKTRRLLSGIASLPAKPDKKTLVAAVNDARRLVENMPEWRGETGDFSEWLSDLEVKKGNLGNTEEAEICKELRTQLREELRPELTAIHTILSRREEMESLYGLLDSWHRRVLEIKRSRGILTYRDAAELAREILLNNQSVRRYYKSRYDAILIDEFQDNNQLQRDLLFLLAEREDIHRDGVPASADLVPGKLFFVGDEKQSIYAFRGADVRVIKHLKDELESIGGLALSMSTNYRSHPALITWFNHIFDRVFSDSRADYEAEFESLQAGISPDGKDMPTLRFFYGERRGTEAEEAADSEDVEAWHVARFIHESVRDGSLLIKEDGLLRPAEFGDFAVLSRSTGVQWRYERIFRRWGIPYTTGNLLSLFVEAPLNDMFNILELILFPHDRLACLAFLRSPLVNLSDDLALRLLREEGPLFQYPGDTVASQLTPEVPESERAKLRHAGLIYRSLSDMADRLPLEELVYHIWMTFGYRFHLLTTPRYHIYLEHYEYLRRLAADYDRKGASLAELLDFIRPKLGKPEKLGEIKIEDKAEGSGVRMMSVHGSKGLEFPVVILANTGNRGKNSDDSSGPFVISEEHGICINPDSSIKNPLVQRARNEAEQREVAELKRILYVAMTRAQDHLVLAGFHTRNNRNTQRALINMIFQALELDPAALPAEGRLEIPDAPPMYFEYMPEMTEEEVQATPSRKNDAAGRISSGEVSPALMEDYYRAESIAEGTHVVPRLEYPVTELEHWWDRDYITPDGGRSLPELGVDAELDKRGWENAFGTLVHEVLRIRISQGIKEGEMQPGRAVTPADLPAGFLPQEMIESKQMLGEANRLAEGFFASELWKELRTAEEIHVEYPFLYLVPEGAAAGDFAADVYASGPAAAGQDSGEEAGSTGSGLHSGRPSRYLRGVMDLFVIGTQRAWVVDFKTDRTIYQKAHQLQMDVYRLAAQVFAQKQVSCYLFYLRTFEAMEVPERLGTVDSYLKLGC